MKEMEIIQRGKTQKIHRKDIKMGYTKVRGYTNKELLDKVKSLSSFKFIPEGFWVLGVRSNEDTYDVFDDKFYVFKGEKFITVMTGTTNTGGYGLSDYDKWSSKGAAQIKADEWYYDVWSRGKHRGKVEALRQVGPFKVIRDGNKNKKSGDNTLWKWEEWKGLNFHPNTYNLTQKIKRWIIGKWSVGCQVANDIPKYKKFIDSTRPQKLFTYCLLDEF
jgi:hypothetical protein